MARRGPLRFLVTVVERLEVGSVVVVAAMVEGALAATSEELKVAEEKGATACVPIEIID